jgi:Holliday junction DNA helicase RuvB
MSDLFQPNELPEDTQSIRPISFDDYTGQSGVVFKLKTFVEAAKRRNSSLDHCLFFGPPGLGKTTLANIIANELGVRIHTTSGPAIKILGQLTALLTNLNESDILFIDEIHRLERKVQEVLYPAMEDYKLDLIIGEGPAARTIRIDLPNFTLVGATTRQGLLDNPLLDRFGILERLDYYSHSELAAIINRAAALLKIRLDEDAASSIAAASRGTPRIAHRLLRRIRDFADVFNNGHISSDIVKDSLNKLEISESGLDSTDRRYLEAIVIKHQGSPVGLETISATISEEPETIENVIEPYLIMCGYIRKTPRGRVAAEKAYSLFERGFNSILENQ